MASQYFPISAPELARQLRDYLDWLATEARRASPTGTLLLGGAYGRGEGGVFFPPDKSTPRLYHNLELFFFTKTTAKLRPLLPQWQETGRQRLGLPIEFTSLTPSALRAAKPSILLYDLLLGHIVIAGPSRWLDRLPDHLLDPAAIPKEEAAHLLINRAIPLLRCLRIAAASETPPEGYFDFHSAKLKLALGDAILCLSGLYHWSCQERHRRLLGPALTATWENARWPRPPEWHRIISWHAEGVEFKFRPRHLDRSLSAWQSDLADLASVWRQVFLWLEGCRLRTSFSKPEDYAALSPSRIHPHPTSLQNLLRSFLPSPAPNHWPWAGARSTNPAVWRSLPLLLPSSDHEALAARILGKPSLRGEALESWLAELWHKRNPASGS